MVHRFAWRVAVLWGCAASIRSGLGLRPRSSPSFISFATSDFCLPSIIVLGCARGVCGQVVVARVGISFVSQAMAQINLAQQAPASLTFDT